MTLSTMAGTSTTYLVGMRRKQSGDLMRTNVKGREWMRCIKKENIAKTIYLHGEAGQGAFTKVLDACQLVFLDWLKFQGFKWLDSIRTIYCYV